MSDVIYIDQAGVKWKRVGECSQCGECCLNGDDPSINNPMFTDSEREAQTCEGHCPLLRQQDQVFICLGHGKHTYYLNGCNRFPSRPEDLNLVSSCSYEFVEV